jgi:hypothetical protein
MHAAENQKMFCSVPAKPDEQRNTYVKPKLNLKILLKSIIRQNV